jgi:hypothetical protein
MKDLNQEAVTGVRDVEILEQLIDNLAGARKYFFREGYLS